MAWRRSLIPFRDPMKPHLLALLASVTPCLAQAPSDTSAPSPTAPRPIIGTEDHVYSYWPVNFRPWATWGTHAKERYVNTGTYGLSFDTSSGEISRLGFLANPGGSAEGALQLDNSNIEGLPTLAVAYLAETSGSSFSADSFLGPGGDSNTPGRLIDGGRFMQRVDIPEVGYSSNAGLAGSIQLATMPRHFVLTHRVTSDVDEFGGATARILLNGPALDSLTEVTFLEGNRAVRLTDPSGEGWVFIVPEIPGTDASIELPPSGGVLASRSIAQLPAESTLAVSVMAMPAKGLSQSQLDAYLHPGESVQVRFAQQDRDGEDAEALEVAKFDPERGVYLVELGLLTEVGAPTWPDWSDPVHQTWYNRHRIVIDADSEESVSIPIALDLGGAVLSSITGGSAMFRDEAGRPLGLPVQISKNWHEIDADPRYWYHFYSTPLLPEGGTHELEFTIAKAKWGETFAASHAQLSLIGWGVNQQWDESAMGCWGESITYDPDMTLNRAMLDDVRPFLVQSANTYNWTGNVGGGDFLTYKPSGAAKDRLGRLRTLYASPGPNLTDVRYAGITADGKIEAHIRTRLGRTDDMVRAYYDLEYTFHEEITYERLALFQVAADNYSDNGFTRLAHGNATTVVFDDIMVPTGSVGYASDNDRGIALNGESPWVMLYANQKTGGNLPEEFADVGFIIRDYELNLNGSVTTTPHINLIHTNNWGQHPQIGFELGLPYDPATPVIPAGTTLRATIEYLIPPADKARYYGPSIDLLAVPGSTFGTPEIMRLMSAENGIELKMAVGTLEQTHPVTIATVSGRVAARFKMTGGFGYVPLVFTGLDRHDGWRLEQKLSGSWTGIGQEVEGNDFWQARYDEASGTYELVFNVDNEGSRWYRLVR